MKIGTRSVLYGAHCVLFHWIFVALGWWKLYGFDRVCIGLIVIHTEEGVHYRRRIYASLFHYRLWMAFLIHDLGYWGKPNMDGPEGETHPEWACRKMNQWYGEPWGHFVLTHSRFYAKKLKLPVSPLCYADKLAITLMPAWAYLPMVRASGELTEYMAKAAAHSNGEITAPDARTWYRNMQAYVVRWVEEHKDGKADTWTTDRSADSSGVWQ